MLRGSFREAIKKYWNYYLAALLFALRLLFLGKAQASTTPMLMTLTTERDK